MNLDIPVAGCEVAAVPNPPKPVLACVVAPNPPKPVLGCAAGAPNALVVLAPKPPNAGAAAVVPNAGAAAVVPNPPKPVAAGAAAVVPNPPKPVAAGAAPKPVAAG